MEATPVSPHLLAGTLAMLLRHCLTGCPHTGLQVADLLERLRMYPIWTWKCASAASR